MGCHPVFFACLLQPLLIDVGWDLVKRLVPLLNTPQEVRVKVSFLLDQVALFANPKEVYLMGMEVLEAWKPSSDYGLYKLGKLMDVVAVGG